MARWLEKPLEYAVAAILFAIMALTVVDVVGRYLFNAPVSGSAEATELALGLLIYAAVPLAAARAEHIRIDILDHLLGAGARRLQRVVGMGGAAIVMGALVWRLWVRGAELAKFGDLSSHLGVPLAPVAYFMAVMSALTAAIFAAQCVRAASGRDAP